MRVLAAAHSGSTDITTGKTVPVAPTPDILTDPATLSVNEGASATYTVVLAREPSANVTVTVASDNADLTADTSTASGTQTRLTFTTNNWNTAQTVTATAAGDSGDSGSADETATLSHTASGGGYDASEYGLIDIDSLDKLNAMRWDLDGDGAASAGETPGRLHRLLGGTVVGGMVEARRTVG